MFIADSDQLGHSQDEMEQSGVLPEPDAPVGDSSILSEGPVMDLLLGPATEPELAEITASLLDVSMDSNVELGPLMIDESESDVSKEL